MRKFGFLVFALLTCLIISGCGREKEKFTVTFDSNGGSSVSEVEVYKDDAVTEPTTPTRDGYVFDGWYLYGSKYDFNTKVTRNITLTAKWTEEESNENQNGNETPEKVKEYKVTFNSNGGSKVTSQTIKENGLVKQPSNPTRKGYEFKGWYLNSKKFDFKTKVTKDINLVAKWTKIVEEENGNENVPVPETKKFTVTFETDGGTSVTAQTVEENGVAVEPKDPTKNGYSFTGWTLNGNSYDFSAKVTKDITLTATWKKNEPVLSVKIERVANSVQNEAMLYVLADTTKVDGVVDIELYNGNIVRNFNVPATGYKINLGETDVSLITNIRLK